MTLPGGLRALVSFGLLLAAVLVGLLFGELLVRAVGLPVHFRQLESIADIKPRFIRGVPVWDAAQPRYDQGTLRHAATDLTAFKIVGLGDSIMYGVGLPPEATYFERMCEFLEERSDRPVLVLNAAVPGYSTMQESLVYEEIDEQIDPNLVIVHYWGDDAQQYQLVGHYLADVGGADVDGKVPRIFPFPPAVHEYLLTHSLLYDLIAFTAGNLIGRKEPNWRQVSNPLATIRDRVVLAGGRMIIFVSPELDGDVARSSGDLSVLRKFGSTYGVEIIDLAEWLRGIPAAQIRVDAVHFNAEGHRRIGERLADYLLANDLRP